MKTQLLIILLSISLLFTCSAIAADKVVVIPMGSSGKKLKNIITVSPKGGDFTDPVAAVNSIIDASADNPYHVEIGPGVYTLSETLVMKPYVSISGAGQDTTFIEGEMSDGTFGVALITGADNASLSDMAINFKGSGLPSTATAIRNDSVSPHIYNVDIAVSEGGNNIGINNISSSSIIEHVNISVTSFYENNQNDGVRNQNSASPTMISMNIVVAGGSEAVGVRNSSSSPEIIRSVIKQSGGIYINIAITNSGTSSPVVRWCLVESDHLAVQCGSSGTIISQSSLRTSSILDSTDGSCTCISSDNGLDKELDLSCAEI